MQSKDANLLRARRFCGEACFTVALQRRRLRSSEPEDDSFVFRWWADLQFLIVALRRLRRSAEIAKRIPEFSVEVSAAIDEFDKSLPGLTKMRNVGEHVDAYAMNDPKRRVVSVDSGQLQVGCFDGTVYTWLGESLNIDIALAAAEKLCERIKQLR
jgi:hypothetical protein